MRITVKQPGHWTFWLALPTRMFLNSLTAGLAVSAAKHAGGVELDRAGMCRLMKELRRMKRKYPRMDLITVYAADGSKVRIRL